MFTGLIETVGRVREVDRGDGTTRIEIVSSLPAVEISPGDSIAVDGVCLTVVSPGEDSLSVDVIPETIERTTLREIEPGRRVNLERALRLGDRVGGHLLQGHVDTTVRILGVERGGGDYRLRLQSTLEIRRFLAEKGSVALHGVSLTIAALRGESFEVALIPETLARTNLSELGEGDRVNVEVDLIARYLEALQRDRFPAE